MVDESHGRGEGSLTHIEIVQPSESGRSLRYVAIAAAAFVIGLVWNRLPAAHPRPLVASAAAAPRASSVARPSAAGVVGEEPSVRFAFVRPPPARRAAPSRR